MRLYFEEIEEYRVEREKRTVSLNLAQRKIERVDQEKGEAARADRLAAIDAAYKEDRQNLDDGLNPGEAGSRYSEVDEDEETNRRTSC